MFLLSLALFSAGCATTGGVDDDSDPTVLEPVLPPKVEAAVPEPPVVEEESKQQEGEVPLAVAETEQAEGDVAEVVVQASIRTRHEAIRDLVTEGQALLADFDLKYVLTGKGKRQTLRGRPVAFALWNEANEQWTIAQIELPRPPVKWKPGRKP